MKTLVSLTTVVIFSLFGGAALAECKKFQGRTMDPVFEAPCAPFELCITTRSTGTLAGENVFFFMILAPFPA